MDSDNKIIIYKICCIENKHSLFLEISITEIKRNIAENA